MADYIKREDAIRIASGYCHPANVAKELAKLPSTDVVEVVRCKDCSRKCICYRGDNYFCSDGERITNETD